jgi:hypothetical protein
MDLKALWAAAGTNGWAKGELADGNFGGFLSYAAAQAGWVPVGTRAGEGPVSTLRPVTPSEARVESMSAVHGLQDQPLHVDGSHMLRPPDVVVMFSREPNATPTRVWKPNIPDLDVDAARHGLFIVGAGRSTFLAPILDTQGATSRFRYDPVIMRPADERASNIAAQIDRESRRQAQDLRWDKANSVVVIANRRVLHGRAAVADTDRDRKLIRMAFYVGETNATVV